MTLTAAAVSVNKFVMMLCSQIVRQKSPERYLLFTVADWVGLVHGHHKFSTFTTAQEAVKKFCEVFWKQTGNDFRHLDRSVTALYLLGDSSLVASFPACRQCFAAHHTVVFSLVPIMFFPLQPVVFIAFPLFYVLSNWYLLPQSRCPHCLNQVFFICDWSDVMQ